MNKLIIILLIIAFMIPQSGSSQIFKVRLYDGSSVEYKVKDVISIDFYEDEGDGEHEFVDLDLPSGTLWATCNIGANNPEENGLYFAWGEIEPQESKKYNWDSYKWYDKKTGKVTKYSTLASCGNVDDILILELEEDAAFVNWGENWLTPKSEDFSELQNNCEWEWSSINGKNGYKVSSKKDTSKYIFLPAAGYYSDGSLIADNIGGGYWTSRIDILMPMGAASERFGSESYYLSEGSGRFLGMPIRAIRR